MQYFRRNSRSKARNASLRPMPFPGLFNCFNLLIIRRAHSSYCFLFVLMIHCTMLLKTLFQEFVNFSSGRWNILLYNITVPVDKECEWNGIELELVGEEIPFIGRKENVLAQDEIVG